MQDRRREQRWPAYLGGAITYSKSFPAFKCLVRNISARGARLAVTGGTIPDSFDLVVPYRQAEYRARTRWRTAQAIGVEFQQGDTAAPIPLSLARRIKQLESENAELRRRLGGDA